MKVLSTTTAHNFYIFDTVKETAHYITVRYIINHTRLMRARFNKDSGKCTTNDHLLLIDL